MRRHLLTVLLPLLGACGGDPMMPEEDPALSGSWEGAIAREGAEFMSFTFTITEADGGISGSVDAEHVEHGSGSGTVIGSLTVQQVTLDFELTGGEMAGEFSYSGTWDSEDLVEGTLTKAGHTETLALTLERAAE